MPNRDQTADKIRTALKKLRIERRGYFSRNARMFYFDEPKFNEILTLLEEALASAEGRNFPRPLGAIPYESP